MLVIGRTYGYSAGSHGSATGSASRYITAQAECGKGELQKARSETHVEPRDEPKLIWVGILE